MGNEISRARYLRQKALSKVDEYHAHEALHVAHVLQNMVAHELEGHPFVTVHPAIKEQVEQVQRELGKLYQAIGAIHFKDTAAGVETSLRLRWCNHCGEGVTNFCRGKSEACPMNFKKLPAAAASRDDVLREAWDAINQRIQHGQLPGNGWDKTAERNGLIMASNIVNDMLGAAGVEVRDESKRPSMSMFATAADYNKAMDEWIAAGVGDRFGGADLKPGQHGGWIAETPAAGVAIPLKEQPR